jgi:hypothetical protein
MPSFEAEVQMRRHPGSLRTFHQCNPTTGNVGEHHNFIQYIAVGVVKV